jgi:recombination protein RecA
MTDDIIEPTTVDPVQEIVEAFYDPILEKAIESATKKWGKNAIIPLDGTPEPHAAISTKAYTLDLALGIGGFPKGRISLILGNEGVGKSTLCMSTCIEAQKQEPDKAIYFIDTEHELDLFYFQSLGLDLSRAKISQPDSAEEALDLAALMLKSGRISVLVLDSIAALKTKEQLEKAPDDKASLAAVARLLSDEFPRLKAAANRTGTCILMTNQWRTGFGGGFSYKTNPGGGAQHYYASVKVDLEAEKLKAAEDAPEVLKVTAKIIKNKVAPPYKIAKFDIEFGKGIVEESCLFEAGITAGVLIKSGAWVKWDEKSWQRSTLIEELKTNENLKQILKDKIRASMNPVQPTFDPETGEILDEIDITVEEYEL